MRTAAICAILLGACVVTGCGTMSNRLLGVPSTLQQSNLIADEAAQEAMVNSLARKASIDSRGGLPAIGTHWRAIAEAGVVEVDIQCDRYLAALFTFNREQQGLRQGLTAAGAATAAILGITGAPGMAIALVAVSFGLAANLFDAGVDSVLFTIGPPAVRAVAAKGRQAFLAGIVWDKVDTRPRMMMVVQGYLNQCTPAAIESNINNASTGAPSVASSSTDVALKAAAIAAPSASVVQDPAVFINTPVAPPTRTPPPLPAANAPPNVSPPEKSLFFTKDDMKALQRALGVTPDGDPGPIGASPRGPTRQAIAEFQTGVKRRNGDPTAGSEVIDKSTSDMLVTAGSLPGGFNSAFERGLMFDSVTGYKTPSPLGIEIAIRTLGGPAPTTGETMTQRLTVLRQAIAAKRTQPGSPLALVNPDALDSSLFDFAKPPPIAQPDPK